MKRIIVMASGSGSNAENIIAHFSKSTVAKVSAVLTNKSTAKVLDRCERLGVPAFYFSNAAFSSSDAVERFLLAMAPDLIVLAGFLRKIPRSIIKIFPNRIINIHPALLPKYGGKGMYGNTVHKAVKENAEAETGITIHYVNENYDEGAVIHQSKTGLVPTDDIGTIAQKVRTLEHEHYPQVIETLLKQQNGAQ